MGIKNLALITGRLGKDPVMTYTQSGAACCKFSIATQERYENAPTQWHNIVAWRKLGEICGEHLVRGTMVQVAGRIEYSSYEKDGVKKYFTDIVINEMEMLSPKSEKSGSGPAPDVEVPEDDLPF